MAMKRLLATATAAALLTTGPLSAAAPAQEGPPAVLTDVGTGLVDSTLLGIDVGDLVNLDLLHDDATSSLDPANGEAISSAAGNPLTLASTVLDPLSPGAINTSSTDGEDTDAVSQDLDGADTALPVVLAVILAATAIGIRRVVSPEEAEEEEKARI